MARINDALWDLRELYRAEQNPQRQEELRAEYDRALEACLAMVDRDISANTAAYNKAVDALQDSITALRKAKRELGDIASTVANVAKAVDAIVKIARAVGAPV
ncbi:MAG: hypothetical protein U1F33_03535 [Alphaproteobacteria bacterium]